MSAAKPAAGDSVPFPFDRDAAAEAAAEALAMTEAERAAFRREFSERPDYVGVVDATGYIIVDGKPMAYWLDGAA